MSAHYCSCLVYNLALLHSLLPSVLLSINGCLSYLNCGVPLQTNEEDEKKMAEKHVVDGVKRVVEKLLARRKLKRSYEYEVQWQGQPPTSEYTTWFPRDK